MHGRDATVPMEEEVLREWRVQGERARQRGYVQVPDWRAGEIRKQIGQKPLVRGLWIVFIGAAVSGRLKNAAEEGQMFGFVGGDHVARLQKGAPPEG